MRRTSTWVANVLAVLAIASASSSALLTGSLTCPIPSVSTSSVVCLLTIGLTEWDNTATTSELQFVVVVDVLVVL